MEVTELHIMFLTAGLFLGLLLSTSIFLALVIKNKPIYLITLATLLFGIGYYIQENNIQDKFIKTYQTVHFKKATSINQLNQIKKEAKEKHQPLFLFFYSNTCDLCVKFKRTTLAEDDIIDFLNKNFISVKIDIENDESKEIQELKKEYEITHTPTFIFYDKEGEIDGKEEGYQGKDEFMETADMTLD